MVMLRPALGLLQGIIIYWLVNYTSLSHATMACAIVILTFPLFALQVKLPTPDALLLGLSILIIMGLIYGYAAYYLIIELMRFENTITPILIAQCSISLSIFFIFYCVAVEEKRLNFPYATLFSEAWQVILKISLGKLLVLLTWGLCWLAAGLFTLLNISLVRDIVSSEAFLYIAPFFFFGIAMTILSRHEDILTKLRNILLAFCQFLYPLFMVISLSFLLVLPFTHKIFGDFWEITILLSVLNIILFNGIYQAGLEREPYSKWFCLLIYASLIITCIYSFFILKYPFLITKNYGIKPYAFLLLISLVILALYNLSYSLAIFFSKKPWLSMIKPANTLLALMVAIVYLALSLPWLHIGKISTAFQRTRLIHNEMIVSIKDPYLYQGYLAHVDLAGADLQNKDLRYVDFSHANLQGVNLSGANLEHAQLQNANLSGANLSRANLKMVNLNKTNLSKSNLTGAQFDTNWLNQVNLDQANLSNTDLGNVYGLEQKMIDSACGENVKLPGKLTIKPCQ